MNTTIGICAHNEEKNIGILLDKLLINKPGGVNIEDIIVVSDGSIDRTNDILREFQDKSKMLRYVIRTRRYGKANAINQILHRAKSPIIILMSADVLPRDDAIEKLVEPFKNANIGIAGAHIVPTNKGNGFMTFLGKFMYKLHHEVALKEPKFGEMIAFRNIIKVAPNTAVDEECIAMLILKRGYKGVYCPHAIVYNKTAANIRDFIRQRRRIYAGHLELQKKYEYNASTVKSSTILRQILKDRKFMNRYFLWILAAILLELCGRALGWIDFHSGKKHFMWDMAPSTKDLSPND